MLLLPVRHQHHNCPQPITVEGNCRGNSLCCHLCPLSKRSDPPFNGPADHNQTPCPSPELKTLLRVPEEVHWWGKIVFLPGYHLQLCWQTDGWREDGSRGSLIQLTGMKHRAKPPCQWHLALKATFPKRLLQTWVLVKDGWFNFFSKFISSSLLISITWTSERIQTWLLSSWTFYNNPSSSHRRWFG